ncbi:hypothetical protein [Actibacterium ureilyticum]|uniref:family 4 glycosyl hydrolase n=1 Tax=Actibacterium ureilyticum TaxID=1590614 RepID=UPI000BAAE40F|nr:hypothetical protein [Actibacterium ureilyticum]
MKLTIIGGSSPFTVNMFANGRATRFLRGFTQITLQGRNAENLRHVQAAVAADCATAGIRLHTETDTTRALIGADVVLVQARFGGLELRAEIEQCCKDRGLFADETLGIGGLVTALRVQDQWRALADCIHTACPSAMIVNMINPLSLSCQILHGAGLRTIGLCEGPVTTARYLASQLTAPDEVLEWSCAGFNHRSYIHGLKVDGTPLGFRHLRPLQVPKNVGAPDPESRAIVSKEVAQCRDTTRWHYGRAGTVADIRAKALRGLGNGAAGLQTSRATPWYDDAVLPFLAAWSGQQELLMTTLNTFDRGLFRETRFAVQKTALATVAQSVPEPSVARCIDRFETHEKLSLACLANPSERTIDQAIACDPLIPDAQKANAVGAVLQIARIYRGKEYRRRSKISA